MKLVRSFLHEVSSTTASANILKNNHKIGTGPADIQDLHSLIHNAECPSQKQSEDFLKRHLKLKKSNIVPTQKEHDDSHAAAIEGHKIYTGK